MAAKRSKNLLKRRPAESITLAAALTYLGEQLAGGDPVQWRPLLVALVPTIVTTVIETSKRQEALRDAEQLLADLGIHVHDETPAPKAKRRRPRRKTQPES